MLGKASAHLVDLISSQMYKTYAVGAWKLNKTVENIGPFKWKWMRELLNNPLPTISHNVRLEPHYPFTDNDVLILFHFYFYRAMKRRNVGHFKQMWQYLRNNSFFFYLAFSTVCNQTYSIENSVDPEQLAADFFRTQLIRIYNFSPQHVSSSYRIWNTELY